jgi:hypothetical protein
MSGLFRCLLIGAVLLLVPQAKGKRLICKDGTYETVLQYELKGDRVRYLSAERHEWEEIPASLVDWPATQKYSADSVASSQGAAAKAVLEQAEEDALSPAVAPGIALPSSGGVFLLDIFQGNPELNPMHQSGAELKKNTGTNILRGIINPVASSRQTIELKGEHARLQSHVTGPAIFIKIDPADESPPYAPANTKDHFRIVRCEEKNGNRIVGAINIAVVGKVKQQASFVECEAASLSGGWIKVTPVVPLASGEYAVVELLGKNEVNQFVWDFGVNQAAPANPESVGARPGKGQPELVKKPKKSI